MNKAIYAKLNRLAKKGIDCALKINMHCELLNILKSFIYDAQSKMNEQDPEAFTNVANPTITKHKGRLSKRLKANIEQSGSNRNWVNRVLKDSTQDNMKNDNNILEDETNNSKGRRCGCCREYGHYAKTCPNVV